MFGLFTKTGTLVLEDKSHKLQFLSVTDRAESIISIVYISLQNVWIK